MPSGGASTLPHTNHRLKTAAQGAGLVHWRTWPHSAHIPRRRPVHGWPGRVRPDGALAGSGVPSYRSSGPSGRQRPPGSFSRNAAAVRHRRQVSVGDTLAHLLRRTKRASSVGRDPWRLNRTGKICATRVDAVRRPPCPPHRRYGRGRPAWSPCRGPGWRQRDRSASP